MKEKLNLTVEQEMKEKANELSDKTGYSISMIFELLIKGATEKEIFKMYQESRKSK